jgi:hypothetical protein
MAAGDFARLMALLAHICCSAGYCPYAAISHTLLD